MEPTLRRLYLAGTLSEAGLESAVSRGWITADDAAAILADAKD